MLNEIVRILKPNGAFRISTPDMEVIINLYFNKNCQLSKNYIRYITDHHINEIDFCNAPFVINYAFRFWGHKFLYNGELLEIAMKKAGFSEIKKCVYAESNDINLKGIEYHGKQIGSTELASFESMIYEGKRPF